MTSYHNPYDISLLADNNSIDISHDLWNDWCWFESENRKPFHSKNRSHEKVFKLLDHYAIEYPHVKLTPKELTLWIQQINECEANFVPYEYSFDGSGDKRYTCSQNVLLTRLPNVDLVSINGIRNLVVLLGEEHAWELMYKLGDGRQILQLMCSDVEKKGN